MPRKKDKPTFNIEQNNTESTALNTSEAQSFLQSLIQNFQQGAYCLLEAMRLVKAKDKHSELDLILNNEEHSMEYEAKQQFPFVK